jgi:hypothetical protein
VNGRARIWPQVRCNSTAKLDRHGGIPQRANLSAHLAKVVEQPAALILIHAFPTRPSYTQTTLMQTYYIIR